MRITADLKVLIFIDDSNVTERRVTTSMIYKQLSITQFYFYKILREYRDKDLIVVNKSGYLNYYTLTDKGVRAASIARELSNLCNR